MAFGALRMTEMKRRCFSKVLFITAWMSTFLGCILLVGGLYIKIHIEGKMNLIEGYNSNVLLIALLVVGGFLVLVDLIGGKLIYDVDDVSGRKRLVPILMLLLIFLLILNLLLFSTGIMCFVHQIHLRNSFHNGILTAMSKYSENDTVKSELDLLQIEFTCCGNDGYEDWFNIQWINNMYLNLDDKRVRGKMSSGHYLNDDAPFSCCDPRVHRPCVHHHVHDNTMHYNYDHRDSITLHKTGCKQSLMDYFSKRLQVLGGLVFVAFLSQMFILLGLRILHTSMSEAEELGDPEATTIGFLFRTGNTSSHKKFKDVEGIVGDGDSDFDDDSTFDDEDFGEEIENQQQHQRSGPVYENTPLLRGDRGGHGQPSEDTDLTMEGLGDDLPEGKKKSPSKKSTKTAEGHKSTVKRTDETRGSTTKKSGKKMTSDQRSKSQKSAKGSPKSPKQASTKSSKKRSPLGSLKKGLSKRSSSKPKSLSLKGKSSAKTGKSTKTAASANFGGIKRSTTRKFGGVSSKVKSPLSKFSKKGGKGFGRGLSPRMKGKSTMRKMPASRGFKSMRGPKRGLGKSFKLKL